MPAVTGWKILGRQSYFGLTRKQLQTLYLVAATGLAALVPLIFFAGYWVQSELGKSRRDVDIFIGAQSTSLSQRIDAAIAQQLSALHALAALPSLDQDADRFQAAAKQVSTAMAQWSVLSLVKPDGGLVFTTGTSDPRIDADLVRRAAAGRRPLIETTKPDAGSQGGILLYEPVERASGVINVFILDFDPSDIRSVLSKATGQEVSSLLIDRNGRLLASSAADATIGPNLLQDLKDKTSGILRRAFEGEPVTTAFTRSELTGWTALVSITRHRSDSLFARPIWATVAAGTLSLLLAGILAVFITHNVAERRVGEERLAASRALGELDARLLATSQEALSDQRKAASEREVLLREIYHRVKNNLQIVQSLLRLGSRDLTPDQREPFENAVRRIGAMARVHTLLYNSPDLASIDFKDYLEELVKELSDGFAAEDRAIAAKLDAEAMRMPLDTAVPLAFIAVEILTNAFKHAFPAGQGGRIGVELRRSGDAAVLRIEDSGVGVGSQSAGKRRLGLTIVRKLVQQIGGELEEPSAGSSAFVIRFPVGEAAPLQTSEPVRPS
jgi:two-component sensor histidine kinase